MSATPKPNDQKSLWNGPAGKAWVDSQELLDRMLRPYEDMLLNAVAARDARRVLDVGCGTGSTTIALAHKLGARAHCLGVDISEPMITLARARAVGEKSAASFICADAQTYAFERASIDTFISRFGVMFFEDPLRAFANLRRAAAEGAEAFLIAWRSAAENPFMTTAERAAAPLLPELPPRKADGPGQFAFADAQHVRRYFEDSGWTADIRAIDLPCVMAVEDLDQYLAQMGPVGMALQGVDDATRARVGEVVRAAFDHFVSNGEVRFNAACWMIQARA